MALAVNYFQKTLHFRCLTAFRMRLCFCSFAPCRSCSTSSILAQCSMSKQFRNGGLEMKQWAEMDLNIAVIESKTFSFYRRCSFPCIMMFSLISHSSCGTNARITSLKWQMKQCHLIKLCIVIHCLQRWWYLYSRLNRNWF